MKPHPFSTHIRLSHLLDALPRHIERGDTPPYMHTLALLESLRRLGFEADLWNAKLESKHKIIVVAGVHVKDEILDWNGQDPRQHPSIYPLFQSGVFSNIQSEDLIPEKREIATKALPMLFDMVKETIEHLWLMHSTRASDGELSTRRL